MAARNGRGANVEAVIAATCAICGKVLPHAPNARPCRSEFISGTVRRFFCPNDGAWVLRWRACPTCGVREESRSPSVRVSLRSHLGCDRETVADARAEAAHGDSVMLRADTRAPVARFSSLFVLRCTY